MSRYTRGLDLSDALQHDLRRQQRAALRRFVRRDAPLVIALVVLAAAALAGVWR